MKNYFSLLLLVPALLLACKAPSEPEASQETNPVNSQQSEVNQEAPRYKTKELRSLKVVGDFDGDGVRDSLETGFYSVDSKTYLDKIAMPEDIEWDSIMVWFDQQNLSTVVKSANTKMDSIEFVSSFGLYCLINLGDLNGDKGDELALVNDRLDMSRLNSCQVYSYCNGKWKVLTEFGVHEDAFDFIGDEQPVFKLISGHLEPRGKKWFYKDYNKQEFESQDSVGQMFELRVKPCKP
ncbi:MAG: hypothetical protein EP332_13100 [Bacteroidetes bacterium]|nr:MAG: hypothetical protein EP332_13100 [Bacteroidota bacterium]